MKQLLIHLLCVALVGSIGLAGCKRNQKPASSEARNQAKRATPSTQSHWSIETYETVRKALAADDLNAAKKGASALAKLATSKATASTNPKAKAASHGIASAANKLASTKDFPAARLAFGELSKHTITLLSSSGSATGLTAYQCPMAKGYKKWLQADVNMANPYMGKRMLKCGGKTKFAP